MTKKIIFVLISLIILAAAFFASYTLSLKYWDKLAPYIDGAETVPAATQDVTTESGTAESTSAAATTQAVTRAAETTSGTAALPEGGEVTVEMPNDDSWSLVLLNRRHRLAEGYTPTLAPAVEGSTIQVDVRVAEAFQKMHDAAKADGLELTPVSGYVSRELQETLYNKKVEEFTAQGVTEAAAEKLAAEVILPAGCSEDNAGLSVSIGIQLDSFSQQPVYEWLKEHAAEYGFIERYTAEKKQITEVTARPWYWRYVGVDAATQMKEAGLCLEEYAR